MLEQTALPSTVKVPSRWRFTFTGRTIRIVFARQAEGFHTSSAWTCGRGGGLRPPGCTRFSRELAGERRSPPGPTRSTWNSPRMSHSEEELHLQGRPESVSSDPTTQGQSLSGIGAKRETLWGRLERRPL